MNLNKHAARKMNLWLLCLLLLISTLGAAPVALAEEQAPHGPVTVQQAIDGAAGNIVSRVGDALSDWDAYALAQAGKSVPPSYLSSAAAALKQTSGKLDLVTDYARLALAVKAAGGSPENIADYNLIQSITNSDTLTAQGANGAIYALIVLNSGTYAVPSDAKWTAAKLVDWLLTQKHADGGWSLSASGQSDVDITAAALTALAPYTARTDVRQAADAGIQWLSSHQLNNGGFNVLGENSESAAQAIIALSALGIDAGSDNFAKANGNLLSYLFTYRQADGGFAHLSGAQTDAAATQQALMALAAYRTFTGKSDQAYDAVLSNSTPAVTEAYVTVHVLGLKGVVVEGSVKAANAFDALTRLLDQAGLPYHATASHYVDSINIDAKTALASTSTGYWLYNVKRQGAWDFNQTNQLGMYDYKVKDGDDIAVYYSGADTQLVQSIVPTPLVPGPGQSFGIQVQETVWDWVYNDQKTTVAANVYVTIGDQKVTTDNQGIASFPAGLPEGTYDVVVTGERQDQAPSIAAATRQLAVGTAGTASVQVEGSQSTYASETVNSGNLQSTLQDLLTVRHIPYQITNYSFGKYFTSIGTDKNGWSFAVRHQGQWEIPQVGMSAYTLLPGDTAVVYFSGYDANYNPTTYLVDSVTLNPSQPKAGEPFTVTVKKTLGTGTALPAQGAQVQIGSQTATTDSLGVASFTGLSEGAYNISVTGYVPGQAPNLVHFSQNVTIATQAGGSPSGPIYSQPAVSLQVIGDSQKGTIYPSAQVTLQNGDTPYSVLARSLGAGRVTATGSGSQLYVRGIDGLMEFDRGPLSGWVYSVNGSFPSTSASGYELKNGDSVEWRYTTDGGQDVGGRNSGGPLYTAPASASGQTASSDITAALAQIGLSYNNEKPVEDVPVSTKLVNADHPMDAAQAKQLGEELKANTVNVEQKAEPGAESNIADPNNEVSLHIPAQAVSNETTVSVKELPTAGARDELVSSMYEFGPQGQKFAVPITLSIRIPLSESEAAHPEQLALVWLNEETGRWIPIPAVIDAETGVVTGQVNHFTKFAVIDKSKMPSPSNSQVAPAMDRAAKWLSAEKDLSDWAAYALHQAGYPIPDAYASSAENGLKEQEGNMRNVTDYERMALGVSAAGKDPRQFAGYDLLERIYNNERMTLQGTNGPIYALVALQSGDANIPADAKWTKEKLLGWVLDMQNADGSWPLAPGDKGNVDLTGAALSALAPYLDHDGVRSAVDKAVAWLSAAQLDNGGFALEGEDNSESTAQVLWGLASAGIDPLGERFVKSGNNMVEHLLAFQQEDGGFAHVAGGASDSISTEQTLLALAAYHSFAGSVGATKSEGAGTGAGTAYADAADISDWALPYVNKAAAYHLMEGTGSRFEPGRDVTRSEFAAILLRLLGAEPHASAASPFADVAQDAWYSGVVAAAVQQGIVNGVSDTEFAPNRPITREEMALMLARALNLDVQSDAAAAEFADASEADASALPAIRAVAANGLMEGADAGRFVPQEDATREMAATVAVRAYEYHRGAGQ